MTSSHAPGPAPVPTRPAVPTPAPQSADDPALDPLPDASPDLLPDEDAGAVPGRPAGAPAGPVRRLLRDSAYVLTSLPIAIVTFTVLVTGLSLAAGLLVTVVGIPVAAATLAAAVGFGHLERTRLAARGTRLAPLHLAPVRSGGLRGVLERLADPRRWAAVLHGIGSLVVTLFTWSVVLTWWVGVLAGLTQWFWLRFLPDQDANTTLPELLDLPMSEGQFSFVLGLVFLATLVPVVRGCADLQAAWARLLLTGASRRALAAQVEDLTARRTAAAAAEARSMRRLERDIHDGPQQRLVRLGMDLSVAERRLAEDPEAARELLAAARAQAAETLAELRALSRGIAPPVLADRGLAAAVSAVAARGTVPVAVETHLPPGRPSEPVENAAYFVVCEALANVAKHAEATRAVVTVRRTDAGRLLVEVVDDGVGGAALGKGHGLAGLVDRVEGVGGRLHVGAGDDGRGTRVSADLPWV